MRLFIVEDDPRLRESLHLLLDGEPSVDVVGVAASAESALDDPAMNEADVVLSDLGLPGMSGVELIRRLKQAQPRREIVAYTVFDDRESVFAALKAGASGYLLKSSTPRELVEGLTHVESGGAPMSPRIARAVVMEFREKSVAEPKVRLTPREQQVLGAIDRGFSYKEIAADLGLSQHTVHGYVKSVYEKLHARGRREAVEQARRRGLL